MKKLFLPVFRLMTISLAQERHQQERKSIAKHRPPPRRNDYQRAKGGIACHRPMARREWRGHLLNWGDNGLFIKSLNKAAVADAKILNVALLGSDEKINWEQTKDGLKLSFPNNRQCEHAYSFKILFVKPVGKHLESEAVNEVMKHGM